MPELGPRSGPNPCDFCGAGPDGLARDRAALRELTRRPLLLSASRPAPSTFSVNIFLYVLNLLSNSLYGAPLRWPKNGGSPAWGSRALDPAAARGPPGGPGGRPRRGCERAAAEGAGRGALDNTGINHKTVHTIIMQVLKSLSGALRRFYGDPTSKPNPQPTPPPRGWQAAGSADLDSEGEAVTEQRGLLAAGGATGRRLEASEE